MLMISRLVEFKGNSGVVEVDLKSGDLLLNQRKGLDRLAAVEMIAQSYAALRGYDDLLNDRKVTEGYLVGVRKMSFSGDCVAGDLLLINVATISDLGNFSSATGEVVREGRVIAEGVIKVWTP
jgi:predicted hotdog family 3-hydroxylacyl-ACP dehydratase